MELFPEAPSRADQRVVQILEAAVRSYASVGLEETTFQKLSADCKVSRPLIHHYFKTKRDVFEAAVKFVRAHLQRQVVEAIQSESEPRAQFRAYVEAHMDWVKNHPDSASVAVLFFYYCAIDPKLRKLNTQLVDMGHERITAMLEVGIRKGAFARCDAKKKARTIQLVITGIVVSLATETSRDTTAGRKAMLSECEALLN